jgi:hypothetical protein
MNIFIIGGERCGKSSAAQYLARALGCDFAETGQPVIRELAKLYACGNGWEAQESVETWERMIRIGKAEFRRELTLLGNLMTKLSPTCLIEHCCSRARIVVGVRRQREVLGFFQKHSQCASKSVWIKVVARQPLMAGSSYELAGQPCDYEVLNDGDHTQLEEKMYVIANKIRSRIAA